MSSLWRGPFALIGVPALFAVGISLCVLLATPSPMSGAPPSPRLFLNEFARAAAINAGLASAFSLPVTTPAWLALRWLRAESGSRYAALGALFGGLFGAQLGGMSEAMNASVLRAIIICSGSGLLMALVFWRLVRVSAKPRADGPKVGLDAGSIVLSLVLLYPAYEYLGFIGRAAASLAD